MKNVLWKRRAVMTLLMAGLVLPLLLFAETKKPVVLRYTQFKTYAYVSADYKPETLWAIDYKEPLREAEVRPYSRKVECRREGNRVLFTLPAPGAYVVYLNGFKVCLFAEEPEVKPMQAVNILSKGVDATGKKNVTKEVQAAIDDVAGTEKTLLFPAGTYKVSQLRICDKKGVKIHLCRGARLRADIDDLESYSTEDRFEKSVPHKYIPGKKCSPAPAFILIDRSSDVHISGYGMIDGRGFDARVQALRVYGKASKGRYRCMLVSRSKDVTLEGYISADPGSWNTHILLSERVTARNVKLMNELEYAPVVDNFLNVDHSNINTDGFDPDSSKDVLIEKCFGYCGDDNVAIKSSQYCGLLGNVERITVRGCVFLTQKSSLKVGTETVAARMTDILFEDNDVLEADRGISLYCYDGAECTDIRWVGNRIERHYADAKQSPFNIGLRQREPECPLGKIDVVIRDTEVLDFFPKVSQISGPRGGDPKRVCVRFENLRIGGTKITDAESGKFKVENASVTFE